MKNFCTPPCSKGFGIFLSILLLMWLSNFALFAPNWGRLSIQPASTITVIGEAKQDEANQIANFTAGIEVIETDKETATNKVNETMSQMLEAIKKFGIEEADIQTSRVSVYQEDEYFREDGRYESEKGDWRAETTIEIKLKPKDGEDLSTKSSELMTLLNQSGANYVYGPNFSLDDTTSTEIELLTQAIANAKEKAEQMAGANKQKVKKIISVSEEGTGYQQPILYDMVPRTAGGVEMATADLEAGTTTLEKRVTVTFELQ